MRTYLLLILCVAFWSGNFIIGRFIRFELEPVQLAFFRWLGVSLIFLPQLIKYHRQMIDGLKQHLGYLLLLSFLGIACFNTFLYMGLQETTATNALLINSSIPMIIILFSMIILKLRISKIQLFGVLLSMLGVVYLALNGDWSKLLHLQFNHGDMWVIASSLTWGLYSTLLKRKPSEIKVFLPTTVFLGTLMLAPVFFLKGYRLDDALSLTTHAKLAILYTVLFASIISFYLWSEGIAKIGADKTGQFTHLMPVFGILLAYIFLGERLHLYHVGGFALIGFGIWLSLFYAKKQHNVG